MINEFRSINFALRVPGPGVSMNFPFPYRDLTEREALSLVGALAVALGRRDVRDLIELEFGGDEA